MREIFNFSGQVKIKAMSQLNVEFDLRIHKTLINHGLDSLNN
tara:strand:- start:2933 stop:3058 length:126 start_codon:yes stop_codon:yes gene_type:complete